MIAGDLRNTLVLITRNGKANDMQTTYSMDILPADHPVFKPDMIPNDFSAFNNFNIARHSYWEKTPEEIQAYLTTGQFPERVQTNNQQPAAVNTAGAYTAPAATVTPSYTAPAAGTVNTATPGAVMQQPFVVPTAVDPDANVAPATTTAPTRNFSGFSF
jgi:hypothetical protein